MNIICPLSGQQPFSTNWYNNALAAVGMNPRRGQSAAFEIRCTQRHFNVFTNQIPRHLQAESLILHQLPLSIAAMSDAKDPNEELGSNQ